MLRWKSRQTRYKISSFYFKAPTVEQSSSQPFYGDRILLFRFDIARVPGKHVWPDALLLTATTEDGKTIAYGLPGPLAKKILIDLENAQSTLGHELDLSSPAVLKFANSEPPKPLPGGLLKPAEDFLRVVTIDAYTDVYILDITTIRHTTVRIALSPELACIFTSQLKDALDALPSAKSISS